MKKALKQGGDDALNVYSTSGGAYFGWAYLPDITDTAQAYLDGIVITWETVPGASTTWAGQYDLGETLTHEAGHWLNLEHTFYGQCNKTGDFVDDTPAQKSPTSGCPEGKDTCRAPGLDPIHNYMDYSFDSCYTEFTDGQTQRMRDAWLFYRAP
jgi:Pregnancy-associated plasma protein-A